MAHTHSTHISPRRDHRSQCPVPTDGVARCALLQVEEDAPLFEGDGAPMDGGGHEHQLPNQPRHQHAAQGVSQQHERTNERTLTLIQQHERQAHGQEGMEERIRARVIASVPPFCSVQLAQEAAQAKAAHEAAQAQSAQEAAAAAAAAAAREADTEADDASYGADPRADHSADHEQQAVSDERLTDETEAGWRRSKRTTPMSVASLVENENKYMNELDL
jgi:hypothetical protein